MKTKIFVPFISIFLVIILISIIDGCGSSQVEKAEFVGNGKEPETSTLTITNLETPESTNVGKHKVHHFVKGQIRVGYGGRWRDKKDPYWE